MSSFANKLQDKAIRTIKHPFKTIVVGVFVFLGLMSANLVFGATIFEDDFEYNLGDLVGQGGWTGTANRTFVQDAVVKHGNKASALYHNSAYFYDYKTGTSVCEGKIGFWFQVKESNPANNTIYFELRSPTTAIITYIGIRSSLLNKEVYLYHNTGSVLLGSYASLDTWYPVDIEWDCAIKKVRAKLNNGEWSAWYINKANTGENASEVMFQHNPVGQNFADFYIDYIRSATACSIANCDMCEMWFDCEVAGCCWFYNPYYVITNYCATCYEGCSWDNCGSCENQEDCESVGCYWTGEYCSWIVSECGGELACQFCETQETCEAEDCYWSTANQTCWYKAPTLPSSWATYYDEHGGYEVPAEFVNDLAETTGKAFDTISSLFEGFAISFSNSDALARGNALGQTIPKARGYLKIFDSLFGHIPIGETFVFILIFMLAIGLFRTIRHLIQIVKP